MKVPAKAKVRILPMCRKKLPLLVSVAFLSGRIAWNLPGAVHSRQTE